jgi:hypothetical protein
MTANKGGRPFKDKPPASVVKLDLANGWLPPGVAEDDSNREVCRQLRVMWVRLTERQQRLVMMFENNPDLPAIAKKCGFSGNNPHQKAEEDLKLPITQKVMRLRNTLVGGTLPTIIARRLLASAILGTHEIQFSGSQWLMAIRLNAMLAGEFVPEVEEKDLPAGATNDATREESDRIMAGVMGAGNAADLLKQRSKEARREREQANQVDMGETKKPEPAPVTELSAAERIKASRG